MLGVLLLVAVCLPPHCQQALLQPKRKKVMKKRLLRVQNHQNKTGQGTADASNIFGPAKKKTKKKKTPPSDQFVTPKKEKPPSGVSSPFSGMPAAAKAVSGSPFSGMPAAASAVSGSPSVGVGASLTQFQRALHAGSRKGLLNKETQGQADAETMLAITKNPATAQKQDWVGRCIGVVFVCPVGMGFGGYACLSLVALRPCVLVSGCVCVSRGGLCVFVLAFASRGRGRGRGRGHGRGRGRGRGGRGGGGDERGGVVLV
jgi:hypothetical protein